MEKNFRELIEVMMMEKIIIYGASESGENLYKLIENKYEVLFFVDGNEKLWKKKVCGKEVYSPKKLMDYKNVSVYLGSNSSKAKEEMTTVLYNLGVKNICEMEINIKHRVAQPIIQELNKRTIDLGVFLQLDRKINLKELTFIPGGSGVLDYAFLKAIITRLELKNYLEIGTYIGESINVVSEVCEKCYSITADKNAPYSMKNWCKQYNRPDFSERLTYANNITHFYENSQEFDYNKIKEHIDLYFNDGDHSYEGIKRDTEKVFASKKEDAIVVWHDFKEIREYNHTTIKAIYDVLGEEFQNVYAINNNICGIYIPEKYSCKRDVLFGRMAGFIRI